MVNLIGKVGGTDPVEGQIYYAQDFIDSLSMVAYRRLSYDDTGGSNNTTTPSLIYTHTIPPNDVLRFVEIYIEAEHHKQYQSTNSGVKGANFYVVRIDVGETGSETPIKSFGDSKEITPDVNNSTYDRENRVLKCYYEPTESEKTNGFNIKIYVYVGNIGDTGVDVAKSSIKSNWVMGV